jgi:hypothetical protein
MIKNSKNKNSTNTILTIVVGFIFIYFLTQIKIALYIAFLIGVISLMSLKLSELIVFIWFKLSYILALIIPNIILTIVFYFFLTPLAFISRIFEKKSPLNLNNTLKSLFEAKNKNFAKESFKNPW